MPEKILNSFLEKQKQHTQSHLLCPHLENGHINVSECRVGTVREKYLENEYFSRSGKSQGSLWMAREIQKGLGKSGKSQGIYKINGYDRQSPENLFILFKKGKDELSHEIV